LRLCRDRHRPVVASGQRHGGPQGDWVLLDCGDVVVHLFRPEVRDFYAIEKMWGLEPPKFVASSDEPADA
jgi:ribosome-associated protein